MSELTILRSHPQWGHTTLCFDSRSNTVGPGASSVVGTSGAVHRAWQPNRVLTQADKNEIERRVAGVEVLLDEYSKATRDAERAWRGLQEAVDAVARECGSNGSCRVRGIGRLRDEEVAGQVALDEVSRKRVAAFTECDFLMVNAPTAEGAQRICQQKLQCFNKNKELLDKTGEYIRAFGEARSEAFELQDRRYSEIQGIFEALVALIQGLISIIREAFRVIVAAVGGAARALSWFAADPKRMIFVAAILGTGVLAFVLRPYFSILAAVIKKKKRKRRKRLR